MNATLMFTLVVSPVWMYSTGIHAFPHQLPYLPARKTHFSPPEKCDLNSKCVLYAEGKYLFPNLSISDASENNCEDDFSGSDDDFLGFYDE
jgi:hypothetical protein